MKTIWLNDIHLEFLGESEFHRFLVILGKQKADSILIAGDIAQAPTPTGLLSQMEDALGVPIYFVLGNHDFYHGSILGVRAAIQSLVERSSCLHWLNMAGVVALSVRTSLIRHDGWGDGRLRDFENSHVELNDFLLIAELRGLSRSDLLHQLQQPGHEAAKHFRSVLPAASGVYFLSVPGQEGGVCSSLTLPIS
jgi:hypothetical protein